MEVHKGKVRLTEGTDSWEVEITFSHTRINKEHPKKVEVWKNIATQKEAVDRMYSIIETYGPDRPYADQPIYNEIHDKEPSTYIRGFDGNETELNELVVDGYTYYRLRPIGRYLLWVKWNHYANRYVDVTPEEREAIKKAGGLPDINS